MTTPEPFRVETFGSEQEPVAIIEGFSGNPAALTQAASRQSFRPLGPHYPGIRAQADPGYLGQQADILKSVLQSVFAFTAGADLVECAFSLVTTVPDKLTPIQRIPHFDSTDPGRLALLHYLCGPETGGTAFYRHRATGYETISAARAPPYDTALRREAALLPDAGYVTGTTPLFEQIGSVDAQVDRMVIYRGYRLHSGVIPPDLPFSTHPKSGRLTINTFLQAR